MFCCPECFADSGLKVVIGTLGEPGVCDFCHSEGARVVDTSRLADYFDPLVALYAADAAGKPLHRLLQDDWLLFAVGEATQEQLLKAILAELGIDEYLFILGYEPVGDHGASWEMFADELKSRNRFLPDTVPDAGILAAFAEQMELVVQVGNQTLYRARVNEDEGHFTVEDMGAPPADRVTNGRANPVGIPYLYTASDPETSIAEVRAHKGERVTVVEFEVVEELHLYDLRAPRVTASPFRQLDEVQFIHEFLPFFELLGRELSRPISPRRANLDYLPSQYLCEAIKKAGHQGILYGSSIADGFNVVLFSQNRLHAGELHEYEIVEQAYRAVHL